MITLERMEAKLETIEKLLGSLFADDGPLNHGFKARCSHLQGVEDRLKIQIDFLRSDCDKLMQSHAALSGQIKGLGDGLAGEIHALRKDQQEKYERLLLLIGITANVKAKKRK